MERLETTFLPGFLLGNDRTLSGLFRKCNGMCDSSDCQKKLPLILKRIFRCPARQDALYRSDWLLHLHQSREDVPVPVAGLRTSCPYQGIWEEVLKRWPGTNHNTDHCSSPRRLDLIKCVGESGIEAGAGIIKGLGLIVPCIQSFSSVLLLLMQ